ncbi:MAG: FliO/MopB family protein [Candidatus Zixiibacteriota bacterium]
MQTPDITPSYAPMIMLFFTFLIIGAGYMAYKKKMFRSKSFRNLEILDRLSLDRKNGVVLVKAKDSLVLLGTSSSGITKLAKIDTQDTNETFEPEIIREKIIEFPKIMDTLRA